MAGLGQTLIPTAPQGTPKGAGWITDQAPDVSTNPALSAWLNANGGDGSSLNVPANSSAAGNNAHLGNAIKGPSGAYAPTAPAGSLTNPSGWTGVSSNADPYGIQGLGQPTGNMSTGQLEMAGPGSSGFTTQTPTTGTTPVNPYTNPNADPNMGATTSAWSQQQASAAATGTPAASTPQSGSSYPAYSNPYGLGSPVTATPTSQPAGGNAYSAQGVTVNIPDTSSRGLNPWSLMGESNARETSSGVVPPQGNTTNPTSASM